jgi:hypothetical protein
MVLFFLGFGVIARFIPPPSPGSDPAEVARLYASHGVRIRAGMVLSAYALVLYVPWIAVLAAQMRRMQSVGRSLSYAQLGLGAGLPVAFLPSLYFFSNASFRPGRSAEVVQALNDQGWLPFTGIIYAIVLQNVVVAWAVFCDRRDDPIYPRWYAYFSVWTALLYCPASLDVFFTDGPLAWNGLLSWWLSLVAFFAWLVVSTSLMLKAARRAGDDRADPRDLERRIMALEQVAPSARGFGGGHVLPDVR